jgi:hypothetical protein
MIYSMSRKEDTSHSLKNVLEMLKFRTPPHLSSGRARKILVRKIDLLTVSEPATPPAQEEK